MSIQIPSGGPLLNRREVYKNQKLQQINQIYYCECGKNYLTFSALYLHARNKHEVKFTTKRTDLNCKIEQINEKSIVTYFIHPTFTTLESHLQQDQNGEIQNSKTESGSFAKIIEVVSLYLTQERERKDRARNSAAVVEQLINYFRQLQEQEVSEYPLEIENITLYFNDFLTFYLPLVHEQKIISLNVLAQSETELIRFWRWLREHSYTTSQLLHRTYPAPLYS